VNEQQNDLTGQVGLNLRMIRKRMKVSLDELANASDVSKLTLGKIERGEANPTLNILWKISRALNVPLTSLLTLDEETELFPFGKIRQLAGNNNDWHINPLFKAFGTTEWYRACVEPNSQYSESHLKGSEEMIIVLNGELDMKVDQKSYHLKQWDVIKFRGEEYHSYINQSNEQIFLLVSLTYPST